MDSIKFQVKTEVKNYIQQDTKVSGVVSGRISDNYGQEEKQIWEYRIEVASDNTELRDSKKAYK